LTSGAPIAFPNADNTVYDYTNWPADAYGDATWRGNKLRIDSIDDTGANVGPYFPYLVGNGNPVIAFYGCAETKDDVPTGNWYVPSREDDGTHSGGYVYYLPDGSKGLPNTGEYVELTPKVDGLFKVAFWANKGSNRSLYIIKKSTQKALAPATDYHAEGWVQAVKDAKGNMRYINPMAITDYAFSGKVPDPTRVLTNTTTGDTLYDASGNPIPDSVDIAGRPKVGYLVFQVNAGETYMLIGNSWQFGLQGYEFTPGGVSGVSNVAVATDDKMTPVYNLAGQRVSASYKGVVIRQGKKYIQR
ncbi:MAG: hypothetical protein I3J02_07870, partial [Prevotella sp.]|nr:hypothetical protein [Prevotella sp.]